MPSVRVRVTNLSMSYCVDFAARVKKREFSAKFVNENITKNLHPFASERAAAAVKREKKRMVRQRGFRARSY